MKSAILLFSVLALVGAGVWLTTGCESTSTADEVITLTPASATLTGEGATASFVASITSTNAELVLPLEWAVGSGNLGRILSTAGLTAIYESNGNIGNNTISVMDQVGQAGVAVINQVEVQESSSTGAVLRLR